MVHRWRGTFAVIDDHWKLVNTNNTNAQPGNYKFYDLPMDSVDAQFVRIAVDPE